MKILIVGDQHYSSENLPLRTDCYPETMLYKTQQFMDIAQERKVDMVVLTGDFGHTKKLSFNYLNKLINIFKNYNIPVASSIGNHDCYNGNPDSVLRTSLGVMFSTGTFLPELGQWTIETDDCFFMFIPYQLSDLPDLPNYNTDKKMILVSHYFYNQNQFSDNIPSAYTYIFDYIILGHDHDNYPTVTANKATILRPGSLSRGSRHKSNLDKIIQVACLDTQSGEVEYIPLSYKPASEIFNMAKLSREITFRDNRLIDQLTMSATQSDGTDIKILLDGMGLDSMLYQNTLGWLREGGIVI